MEESDIISYLNFSKANLATKAKKLGYRKTTVRVDGVRKTGWVRGESLFLSLKNLIEHHKRFPLGFDYYYWGFQLKKDRYENINA